MNLVESIRPAIEAGAIIDRATAWPWIIELGYSVGGVHTRTIQVLLSTVVERPPCEDLLPAGAELGRSVVFPATRFEDMADTTMRRNHRQHYEAFLMWRKARECGKPLIELEPWADFDPVAIDEAVRRWVLRGSA